MRINKYSIMYNRRNISIVIIVNNFEIINLKNLKKFLIDKIK